MPPPTSSTQKNVHVLSIKGALADKAIYKKYLQKKHELGQKHTISINKMILGKVAWAILLCSTEAGVSLWPFLIWRQREQPQGVSSGMRFLVAIGG